MMMMISKGLLFFAFIVITSASKSAETQTYVIHIDKTKISSVITQLSETQEQETTTELLYTYNTVFSGFAAKLSPKQLESLKKLDGFLSAFPDEMLSLHTTHSPQFLGLQVGKGLLNKSSLAIDTIIGVADTGIWPEHVSFRDSGFTPIPSKWKGVCEVGTKFSSSNCNKKIVGARSYFKGYEAAAGRINETEDYRSPRDVQGHGTHTASTAAGNLVAGANVIGLAKGFASGMRFTSRIAVYKVCWKRGCASSDIIAAMDQAVVDGVDVLSLSLGGSSRPFYTDPIAIASFGAVQNRVFVSCSAGNSGPLGSTVSNGAPWIMTVAASYTDRTFPAIVKLGNGAIFEGSSLYSGKRTKQLSLVYKETAGSGIGAAFCLKNSLDKKLVKGKIVVCLRGINGRTDKGEVVKSSKGGGMLLINLNGEEIFADAHVLPAASLGETAGNLIRNYINSTRNPKASIFFKGTVYGNPAPIIAAFSSRGPSLAGPEVIKPDITAPGMSILAAWPAKNSPSLLSSDRRRVLFNIISGTSMSCPHVSGIASLIKSVHQDWSPAAIKSALMTTAYNLNNRNEPISDIGLSKNGSNTATPFSLGSGHIDPEKASDPGLVYDITTEDYLQYFCNLNYNSSLIFPFYRQNFTCPNHDDTSVGDLNYPSFAVNFEKKSRVRYQRTVTNVGLAMSSYAVRVEEPRGVKVKVMPEVLKFKKVGERLKYSVSFVGGKKESAILQTSSSFGALVWVCGKYEVRSPIAVTWQQQ